MSRDREPWIQLSSGRPFFVLDPKPEDFDIATIAHALARLCRFNGHVRAEWYSVAEHSVYVSLECDEAEAFEGLMHDAAEAFISDITRPVKPLLGGYKAIEERIERAIAERFCLRYPWPASVRRADNAVLRAEQRDLMPPTPLPDVGREIETPMARAVVGYPPAIATQYFLRRFAQLSGETLVHPLPPLLRGLA